MPRTFNVVQVDAARPKCEGPENLALVDAAFERPGGPEAQRMKATLCKGCPIGHACLAWAMTWRESGIWGGTGPKGRTQHGAPGGSAPGARAEMAARHSTPYRPKAAADVSVKVIRAWALEHGLPVNPHKGKISEAIRELYDAAHGQHTAHAS